MLSVLIRRAVEGGFWLEDKKSCECVWNGGLEGDFEASWMVLGKIGV